MRTWSFYDASGAFVGQRFSSSDGANLAANTPPGCKAIEGGFDHLSQRVDLETGEVVDYQPPRPSDDHEWNAERRRWLLSAAAQARIEQDRQARAEIAGIELANQRAIREALLTVLPDGELRERLQRAEAEIASKRPSVITRSEKP